MSGGSILARPDLPSSALASSSWCLAKVRLKLFAFFLFFFPAGDIGFNIKHFYILRDNYDSGVVSAGGESILGYPN